MLGTSGFLGLAIGPIFGDWLLGTGPVRQAQLDRMFWLAALAGLVSLAATALATRGQVRQPRRRPYPAWIPLVRRYHPGVLLLVALAMGLGTGLPCVFVRAFAAELGLSGITSYFLVYAAVAFAARIMTRRWPEILGIRWVMLIGLASLAISMLLYLIVHSTWQLAIPATVAGLGHALLFPAIVAGGTLSFPSRYRGLATTLVLGMLDVGNLLGQPAVGFVLHYAGQCGLPKYPTMFVLVAMLLTSVAAVYGWQTRHDRRESSWKKRPRRAAPRHRDRSGQELAPHQAPPLLDRLPIDASPLDHPPRSFGQSPIVVDRAPQPFVKADGRLVPQQLAGQGDIRQAFPHVADAAPVRTTAPPGCRASR